MIKLKWKVDPEPTGRYRSFEFRGWPTAYFKGIDKPAVAIYCSDEYVPANVKEGKHSELKLMVAIYNEKGTSFNWRTVKKRAKTLSEAKQVAEQFWNLDSSKKCLPLELR